MGGDSSGLAKERRNSARTLDGKLTNRKNPGNGGIRSQDELYEYPRALHGAWE